MKVAQSASAGFMYPWCAFLTGIGAGIAYVSLRLIVLNVLKIDDVTDAFAGAHRPYRFNTPLLIDRSSGLASQLV